MKFNPLWLLFTPLLGGCGHHSEPSSNARPELPVMAVRTKTAERKPREMTEEVVGTVVAKLRTTLEAKLNGRIDQMPVLLGQKVKAGELVAHLDVPEIKARLEQAEAGLLQAEREWKRSGALLNQKAATQSDYDMADSRYRVAKAAVAEAQAMMGYIQILCPFDAVVTKKWADIGDLAIPGKPLVSMEDPSALQLEADIPEAIASRVHADAQLPAHIPSLHKEVSGAVKEIAPTADPVTRTLRVKLDLPSTPGLMSGQFARLLVPVGESQALRVPSPAIVVRGQMEMVFVVNAQKARMRLIKTGGRFGEETEILSGLEPGETVVVEGATQLVDGQPVEVK